MDAARISDPTLAEDLAINAAAAEEAADLIISRFAGTWQYNSYFRFALAACQRVLMSSIPLDAPSLEIGINDGSSATVAQNGKPKFSFGGDMPEENTFESRGLYVEPEFDAYENVIGMDAHEIPFPDESFNTVITNDMLSYGLDRKKIVDEMVRVLAPGGTLFLTESTGSLHRYPNLLKRLKKAVPTIAVLDDPGAFYLASLQAHGFTSVAAREYLDERLVAMMYAAVLRGEAKNAIDAMSREAHEDGLRAVARLLVDDSASTSRRGWQVAVKAVKAGNLNRSLEVPEPMCLSCKGELRVDLDGCVCLGCKKQYLTRYGDPYVLTDYARSYSGKREGNRTTSAAAVEALIATLVNSLRDDESFAVVGVDVSTRYLLRCLKRRGIKVARIYSDNPASVGHFAYGIPIVAESVCGATREPIIVSVFSAPTVAERLLRSGFGGMVYTLNAARDAWLTARM